MSQYRRFGSWRLLLVGALMVLVGSVPVATSHLGRLGSTPAPVSGMGSSTMAMPSGKGTSSKAAFNKAMAAYNKAMAHMERPTFAAFVPDAPTLEPDGWTVTASSQSAGHPASRGSRLDGSRPECLHLLEQPALSLALPQWVTIDMRGLEIVSGLTYQPLQGANPEGAIGGFQVSISTDGVNFNTVASGTWANTTATKEVGIEPVRTRFVRLTALSFAAGSGSSISAEGISLAGNPTVQAATVDERDQGSSPEHEPLGRRRVGADDRLPARPGRRRAAARQQDAGVVGRPGHELRTSGLRPDADRHLEPDDRRRSAKTRSPTPTTTCSVPAWPSCPTGTSWSPAA